jgi:hypothetical protein
MCIGDMLFFMPKLCNFLSLFFCYQISHKLDPTSQFPLVGIWNIVKYESSLHFSIIGPLI